MPLRYVPNRAALLVKRRDVLIFSSPPGFPCHSRRRWFHGSTSRRNDVDRPTNHYETLNVYPDASPADIKKSFYQLSKTHHPDHNPEDPHAGRRFMRISEAYSILGHADKRARYDRDVMRHHGTGYPHQKHHQRKGGSYHSSGPAGGRPASGLSRRRTTFTGPPPSFFRSGGWGAQAARERGRGDPEGNASRSGPAPGTGMGGTMGGMGPGQDPYGRRDDVRHFDREAHERTQRRVHERSRARQQEGGAGGEGEDGGAGTVSGFLTIAGVLATAVLLPLFTIGVWKEPARRGRNTATDATRG